MCFLMYSPAICALKSSFCKSKGMNNLLSSYICESVIRCVPEKSWEKNPTSLGERYMKYSAINQRNFCKQTDVKRYQYLSENSWVHNELSPFLDCACAKFPSLSPCLTRTISMGRWGSMFVACKSTNAFPKSVECGVRTVNGQWLKKPELAGFSFKVLLCSRLQSISEERKS
jgi:hypothetical protein